MNLRSKVYLCLLAFTTLVHAENHDFINFENDDTLHGKFIGFTSSGKIIWKNDHAEKNIAFDTTEVRKVVMNNGKRTKPFTHISHVTLKNFDTIPGQIISLNKNQLKLKTDFGGEIIIPKKRIHDINFNPLGDKIIYRGPFSKEEGWNVMYPANKEVKSDLTEKEIEDAKPWKFKNFSFSHQGSPSSIILNKEVPDKFRITFNSYSSQSYYPTLTILADLTIPKFDEDDKDLKNNRTRYSSSLGNYLGTSLVIRLHPSSSSLTHYGFKEDGTIFQTSLTNMVGGLSNKGTKSKTFYDLRVDKKAGLIMLFADKRNVGQWQIESLSDQFKGSHFGFNMQYSNAASISVVSDIVFTSWNGVRDSAISLENETRDIVMFNNGTDRYSGKITTINDTSVNLKSAYAELTIPQDQISTITLSSKKTEETETRNKDDVTIRFYGTGKITGKISNAEEGYIFIESETLGKIKVKTEYITSFEFIDMDYAYEGF